METLTNKVCVEGSVRCRLFKSFGRGVDGLSGGGEDTGCQYFDLLGVVHHDAGIDYFLLRFM